MEAIQLLAFGEIHCRLVFKWRDRQELLWGRFDCIIKHGFDSQNHGCVISVMMTRS